MALILFPPCPWRVEEEPDMEALDALLARLSPAAVGAVLYCWAKAHGMRPLWSLLGTLRREREHGL